MAPQTYPNYHRPVRPPRWCTPGAWSLSDTQQGSEREREEESATEAFLIRLEVRHVRNVRQLGLLPRKTRGENAEGSRLQYLETQGQNPSGPPVLPLLPRRCPRGLGVADELHKGFGCIR